MRAVKLTLSSDWQGTYVCDTSDRAKLNAV